MMSRARTRSTIFYFPRGPTVPTMSSELPEIAFLLIPICYFNLFVSQVQIITAYICDLSSTRIHGSPFHHNPHPGGYA
jgi:hypothetical protein